MEARQGNKTIVQDILCFFQNINQLNKNLPPARQMQKKTFTDESYITTFASKSKIAVSS